MAFREVDVIEVREVLRGWLDGGGLRTVAEPEYVKSSETVAVSWFGVRWLAR